VADVRGTSCNKRVEDDRWCLSQSTLCGRKQPIEGHVDVLWISSTSPVRAEEGANSSSRIILVGLLLVNYFGTLKNSARLCKIIGNNSNWDTYQNSGQSSPQPRQFRSRTITFSLT